jgi:tetratricopeptide (TPR) repeat protein
MPALIPYIGREELFEQIKRAIDARGERRVICIHGPGGIGKTRLLQEVQRLDVDAFVTDIVDFDDIALRVPANIEFALARQIGQRPLGRQMFDAYLKGLQDHRRMLRAGADPRRLAQQQSAIRRIFEDGFNEFSSKQRVVLLFDTTDTLEGTEAWNYVVHNLPQQLRNLVLIIAGRNAEKVYQELQSEVGQDVILIELVPLDEMASTLYLQRKQEVIHISLETGLVKKLALVAGGLPIRIDLAVDWLAHDIPLDWLSDSDLWEFGELSEEEKKKRQDEFERELVLHIAKVRRPMDRLTLAMSHVYPLDIEMMAELLRMPEDEARKLFDEAKIFVFVKSLPDGRISLHDEMRDMVNKHVWPQVDGGESRRQWYSELAIAGLERRAQDIEAQIVQFEDQEQSFTEKVSAIDPLSEQEVLKRQLWTLRARTLRHQIYLNPEQGFEEFDSLFHKAFRRRESDFCIMLKEIAETYRKSLSVENQKKLDLSKGLLDILKGDSEAATDSLRAGLKDLMDLDPGQGFVEFNRLFQEAFDMHNTGLCAALLETTAMYGDKISVESRIRLDVSKGLLAILQREREVAIKHLQDGLERLERLGVKKDLDHIYNALGYGYRLQGEWELAIASYERALYFSRMEGDAEQIAETMNNIANICRFNGDFERGLRYTKISLEIRESLGDKLSIANSCYVRGMISWEIGNTAEAAAYLMRARKLYQELNNEVRIAWVDKYIGYFHYRIGDVDTATEYLKQAEAVFRGRQVKSDLAEVLNELSRVTRRRNITGEAEDATFAQAERYAIEGLEIAQEIDDHYKTAECTLSLCVLYYRWGREHQIHSRPKKAKKYFDQAQKHFEAGFSVACDGNYVDLLSVYQMTAGNVAYDEGVAAYKEGERAAATRKWDEAFKHYVEECHIAASYKKMRFDRALSEIASRLMRLPTPELTQKYCNWLVNQWKRRRLEHQYPQLVDEFEQVKHFLDVSERSVVDQFFDAQMDLLAMGDWQGALEAGQQVLAHNRVYLRSPTTVRALNASAFAWRQLGHFYKARRLCTQSLHIGEQLLAECQAVIAESQEAKQDQEVKVQVAQAVVAESRYVMGTIHWIVGNTAEAATYLRLARESFEKLKDAAGAARVRRYEGFLYYRIGNLERSLELLEMARICFEKRREFVDLIDVLTVQSRVMRESARYDEAREAAKQAGELARKLGNNYVVAETLINLYLLNFQDALVAQTSGDKEKTAYYSSLAQQCFHEGYEIAHRFKYDLLVSVYEQVAGDIAFQEDRWGQAFEHYVAALKHGARFEYARLHRSLDVCIDRLVQLPADSIRRYADYVIREWRTGKLDVEFPDVVSMFELCKEYREYVSQA